MINSDQHPKKLR
jgi:DNA replication licensing factor MCM5